MPAIMATGLPRGTAIVSGIGLVMRRSLSAPERQATPPNSTMRDNRTYRAWLKIPKFQESTQHSRRQPQSRTELLTKTGRYVADAEDRRGRIISAGSRPAHTRVSQCPLQPIQDVESVSPACIVEVYPRKMSLLCASRHECW